MNRREQGRRITRVVAGAIAVASAAALAACGSSPTGPSAATPSSSASSSASASPAATASSAAALPAAPAAGKKFYVSIGDSYAAGYQPSATGKIGVTSTTGFVYRLAREATVKGSKLTVVNFACAGATTTSVLKQNGCGPFRLGPGALNYPTTTQAKAAVSFISEHQADVGLITVSISGNDVTGCGKLARAKVVPCLTKALVGVKSNLHTLLAELRAAAGPKTAIVGITYPDVILGLYLSKLPKVKELAPLSITGFKLLINPLLKTQYDAFNATFVDVTEATGAYIPFTQTTTLAPYGTLPQSVAKVCTLTFFCQFHDIHPRDNGYQLIADLINKALPAS